MNNDCNHNKCQCNSDKCGISLKTIPAALGDDTGEFKPENGAYCNTFVKYEANGAQYFYSKDGIFSKVAEIPGYVKQQSDFAETNEESPAFIKNKELVATAEQLDAEATARAEQDEFLHNENVSLGNELNEEKNARIQKDTQLDNAINTKAAKVDLQTEISARQSAVQAEAAARQNAIQAEATARKNADKALSDRMDAFSGMDYVVVEQLPTVGEKGKVYLVPKQGEQPDVHDEFIWVNGQWELIGSTQMDLTDYIKNTDYASTSGAGIVKVSSTYAVAASPSNGNMYTTERTYAQYSDANQGMFIGKATLENVLNGRKYLMPEYTLELPTTGNDNKLYLTPATEQPDIEDTASGKDVELADASEGDLIDWTIKGDTEQASYTGKNLLNYTGGNYSGNGITITNNGGNTFTYNGALTAGFNYVLGDCSLKAGRTYTASLEVLSGSAVQYYVGYLFQILDNNNTSNFSASIGTTKKSVQFTPTADVTSLRFWHPYNSSQTNESFSNFKFRLQIEEGSSATDFEPYVGGTSSPSPDYPQEVKTVTGRQTVSVVGKNILNYVDGIIPSESGITNVINEDGTITTTGKPNKNYATIINYYDLTPFLEDGATYTISSTAYDNKTAAQVRRTAIADGSTYNWDTLAQAKTFTVDKSLYTYRMGILTNTMTAWGDNSLTITKGYQLEKNSSATSFQPYHEQEVEINLGDIELCKLGEYQDRIYKDGDTWKIEKQVGRITRDIEISALSGTSSGATAISSNGAFQIYGNSWGSDYSSTAGKALLSSNIGVYKLQNISGNASANNMESGTFCQRQGTNDRLYFRNVAYVGKTGNEIRAILLDKIGGANFYYPLPSPVVTVITDQPLIDQLNELETLTTVKGYNRITTDTQSIQPFLEFGYFRPDPSVTKDEWLWVENHYEQIGSHRWGSLTGNISEQQDLKHELDSIKDSIKSKVDKSDNSLVRSDEATKLKVLTQAQYDALTPAADTIYFIKEA